MEDTEKTFDNEKMTTEQEEQLWMNHYEQMLDYEDEKAKHLRWYYLVTN